MVQAAPAHLKQTSKTSPSPRSRASTSCSTVSSDSSGFDSKIVKSRFVGFHSCALLLSPIASQKQAPWLEVRALNTGEGRTSLFAENADYSTGHQRADMSPPNEKPPHNWRGKSSKWARGSSGLNDSIGEHPWALSGE